ncbi:MAG: hypothetical protein GX592_14240 [Clostridiales bacterium]|nr:hypothetical protein [Clostridiales bacterium]
MANATVVYPRGRAPETVRFRVSGARPSAEEAARLTAIPFERTPPSAEEVKDAFKWFFFGVIGAIALWFFGNWVIRRFVGPGVLFFGYGGAYVAAPILMLFGIVSLGKLLRSARKKKAKAALEWLWMTSLLGENSVGKRFGKPDYAISTLYRLVPKQRPISGRKIADYIDALRKALSDAADETTIPAKEEPPKTWQETGATKSLTVTGEAELFPGVKELSATICFKDCLSRGDGNNKTVTMVTAVLEIEVTQSFICSGGYWYPYELTSPIERLPALGSGGDAESR